MSGAIQKIDGRRTALVIVDLQNDFLDAKGAYARGGDTNPMASPLPERAAQAARALKAAGGLVTASQFTLWPDAKGGPMISPHLKALRPFGIALHVEPGATGNGFAAKTTGPAYDAARKSLSTAWGGETVSVASGGSIPLVNSLHTAAPDAEILLLGATDGFSNIHAPNERVRLDEFEKTVVAEAEFFREYAARWQARH